MSDLLAVTRTLIEGWVSGCAGSGSTRVKSLQPVAATSNPSSGLLIDAPIYLPPTPRAVVQARYCQTWQIPRTRGRRERSPPRASAGFADHPVSGSGGSPRSVDPPRPAETRAAAREPIRVFLLEG